MPAPPAAPRRICFLTWRDTGHPEGGGSEVYVEHMARWLAAQGHDVTIVCAAYGRAPANEVRDGVRFRRRGGRLTVYPRGLAYLLGRGRRNDVVVDVANGVPFFSPLVRRRGLRILVHHVHREQWQIIYPGLLGSVGWWIESRVAPALYRRVPYMTVSQASRADLVRLGVDLERIDIVYNGIDVPHPSRLRSRSADPRLCVLGRLVPHKQVEHAIDTLAALRDKVPGLRLDVVGDGWWAPQLHEAARLAGVSDLVTFHGHVSDDERDTLLDAAWLMLAPSVKEGWGIAIMEAAARGVPALAYSDAGGVTESIVDGETGLLVENRDDLVHATARLLTDTETRLAMGKAARERARNFGWTNSSKTFEQWALRGD
jgi:glycosyltransferase involved in cell wall biosynthesis